VTIVAVGTPGASGSGITIGAALTAAQAAGSPVTDVGSGVTLSSPLHSGHTAGEPAQDVGSGITLARPLGHAHPIGITTRDAGTGLSLASGLRYAHADGQPATTPGTGLRLASPLRSVHAGGDAIASSGITFTPPLSLRHAAGTSVGEAGLQEPPLDTPLPAYWGFVLTQKLAQPGAAVSELPSPISTVRAYRSVTAGTLSIMLINTDDTAPARVALAGLFDQPGREQTVANRRRGRRGVSLQTFSYGLEVPEIVQSTTVLSPGHEAIVLAPESLMVLTMNPDGPAPDVSLRDTP
jgi:hypothetical protein